MGNSIIRSRWRRAIGVGFLIGALIAYLAPLWSLAKFAWGNGTFSYILLVPVVSAYFFYENRERIFTDTGGGYYGGLATIVIALGVCAIGAFQGSRLSPRDYTAVMVFSFVILLVGAFWIYYGYGAVKAAAFPLFFLVFMVPIPTVVLDKSISFLQKLSADVSYAFFRLTGVPVNRDGYLFHLPGLSIEVARQCSGIRSSISLFLVSLIAGQMMLRNTSRRVVLALSVLPIAIVKNAVRIVTLSLLAVYVDPRILGTVAHRRGGIPIFLLALVFLGCVLWFLRRTESKRTSS